MKHQVVHFCVPHTNGWGHQAPICYSWEAHIPDENKTSDPSKVTCQNCQKILSKISTIFMTGPTVDIGIPGYKVKLSIVKED